ncbi:BC1872 family protein [Cohnella silvisoli]|uniref:Phage ABA sandwich domain-containing protein n=1 Tax=Cohnella silvisoli TaxID=2873699 RepID=A0ABV1KYS1_9BACL|nr:hypothetical protein [Cohnella silvisoli]MCD9024369.1 hypothetical protein [Cohnella silvisoli]
MMHIEKALTTESISCPACGQINVMNIWGGKFPKVAWYKCSFCGSTPTRAEWLANHGSEHMTREEIIAKWAEMTPRERDAWVAEAVFGYSAKVNHDSRRVEWYARNPVNGGMTARPFEELPNYTTNIAVAWTVVDRMSSEGFPFVADNNHYEGKYSVGFYSDDVTLSDSGHKSTASEAICLAAIITKCERNVTTK